MHVTSLRNSFSPHPLAWLAVSLAAGILATRFAQIPLLALLGCGAGAGLIAMRGLGKRGAAKAWIISALLVFAILTGATLEAIEKESTRADRVTRLLDAGVFSPGDPVELTGVLELPPEVAPEKFYLTLRVEKLRFRNFERPASGLIELMAPVRDQPTQAEYDALELRRGARLRVMIDLERSDNYRNPGVSSFTEYLERKGFDATGVIKSPLLVERLDDVPVFLPLAWLYEWRRRLEKEIRKRFTPETAGVLDAALLGNRYNLSHSAAERFREGGTFHVLVISGLHISFIGGLTLLVARRITKRKVLQFCLSATILWAYAIVVGAQSSVVRAALMFTLIALAPVLSRRVNSLNALGGATLILLVWQPRNLFDPSFQLTILSVLAIVVMAAPLLGKLSLIGAWQPTRSTPRPPSGAEWLRRFCEGLYWSETAWRREMTNANYSYRLFKTPQAAWLESLHLQRPLRYAMSAVIVSLSVQLALVPLLILYFHRLSVTSVFLNIFVGLLMALLGIVALGALVVVPINLMFGAGLLALANGISWLMVHSVDLFANAGIGALRLPEYSGWCAGIYALYYLPLAVLVVALARWVPSLPLSRGHARMAAGAAVLQFILLLIVVVHPLSAPPPDGRLRVDFLDVGQGDAALVTMPDGTTLLIDGGGRPNFRAPEPPPDSVEADDPDFNFVSDTRSVGEAVVSEYLWHRGLDRVDYILATHADADHIDGLNDVARNFKVRTAFVARTPDDDSEYQKFAGTLRDRKIPLSVIGSGDVLHFGVATATVLWPSPTADKGAPSRNNDSLVLRLQFGRRTILMTGDVEKEGEAAILAAKSQVSADVVKVPHHGSRTSSTPAFVSATHPGLAIVSVGLTSVFGHPHAEVVERWRNSGAVLMTTGQRGAITVSTDGEDLRVDTFVRQ
jgi:competence protein ComEC